MKKETSVKSTPRLRLTLRPRLTPRLTPRPRLKLRLNDNWKMKMNYIHTGRKVVPKNWEAFSERYL